MNRTLAQALKTRIPSVNSIGALKSTVGGEVKAVHVRDPKRGGDFFFAASGFSVNNVTVFAARDPTNQGQGGYWVREYVGAVNVMWAGAKADGATDDSPAINQAISVACETILSYQLKPVFVPEGKYMCNSTINLADKNGIVFEGTPGRIENTTLFGNTGGIALDFCGSTNGTIRNLCLQVYNGLSNPSIIGIQQALTKNPDGSQRGGLNQSISGVAVKMGDFIGYETGGNFVFYNGGLCGVGLLNCRAEECSYSGVNIEANTPIVFTTTHNLGAFAGYTHTVSSPNALIQDNGTGSMGVTKWDAQCSLRAWNRLGPALVLDGVNTFDFHGYITRLNVGVGSYETAIRCTQATYGLKIHATIEGFSQILATQNEVIGLNMNVTTANHHDSSRPSIHLDDYASLQGFDVNVTFGNINEYNNGRQFIETWVAAGNDTPTHAALKSGTFNIPQLTDNASVIQNNLLKQCENVHFNTANPFEKKGGFVRSTKNLLKNLTTVQPGGTTTAALFHFTKAKKATMGSQNAGFLQVPIAGTLMLGDHNTFNGPCTVYFEARLMLSQRGDGVTLPMTKSMSIFDKVTFNGGYLDVTNLDFSITYSGEVGAVNLIISTAGSGAGEGVNFSGDYGILGNYAVEQPVILD